MNPLHWPLDPLDAFLTLRLMIVVYDVIDLPGGEKRWSKKNKRKKGKKKMAEKKKGNATADC